MLCVGRVLSAAAWSSGSGRLAGRRSAWVADSRQLEEARPVAWVTAATAGLGGSALLLTSISREDSVSLRVPSILLLQETHFIKISFGERVKERYIGYIGVPRVPYTVFDWKWFLRVSSYGWICEYVRTDSGNMRVRPLEWKLLCVKTDNSLRRRIRTSKQTATTRRALRISQAKVTANFRPTRARGPTRLLLLSLLEGLENASTLSSYNV